MDYGRMTLNKLRVGNATFGIAHGISYLAGVGFRCSK